MSQATLEQPPVAPPATPAQNSSSELVTQAVQASFEILRSRVDSLCSDARKALLQPILNLLWASRQTPASSKHANHGACSGGLILHILDVMDCMTIAHQALGEKMGLTGGSARQAALQASMPEKYFLDRQRDWSEVTPEACVTVALVHDLNKISDLSHNALYVPNILKSGKQSDAAPYSTADEYDEWEELRRLATHANRHLALLLPKSGSPGCPQIPSGLVSLALAEKVSPGLSEALLPHETQAILFHAGLYEKCDKTGFMGCEHPLSILIHFADMLSSRVGF